MASTSSTSTLPALKRALRKSVQQTLRALPLSAVEAQCEPPSSSLQAVRSRARSTLSLPC